MPIPWLDDAIIHWRDCVDIILVTILLYRLIIMVQGTRAVLALHGLLAIIIFYGITRPLGFNTINWILENFLSSIVLIVIIVFQRDIRLALTYMGSQQRFFFFSRKKEVATVIEQLTAAAAYMAKRKIGALIVVEGRMPLADTIQGGIQLDAQLSKELLISLFWYGCPLHDGAVVISEGKIASAGNILPLTTLVSDKQDYGTRHRAALGITEETDAVVVVVSEERGAISVAMHGKLMSNLDVVRLRKVLSSALEKNR